MNRKWQSIVRQSFRDAVLTIFGGWVIWKQVYAQNPNAYLILVGFACMVPSARAAVISILSDPGSSSRGSSYQEQQGSQQSSQGAGGEPRSGSENGHKQGSGGTGT